MLAVGFLILIAIGTLLLKLPIAHHSQQISWLKSAFTATSAVTVTGLSVVSTTDFTYFGQVVIALLIQAGGLGFMTFAVLAFISLQGRLGLSNQLIAQQALGQTSLNRVTDTAKAVVMFSLFFEFIGFVALTLTWQYDLGWSKAAYQGFFYTISAFNNAGFGLTSANLMPYVHSFWVNIIITSLIIIGGLGFLVLMDIKKNKRWSRFNVNTKLMLMATLFINLAAFILFWLLEAHNPLTIGSFTPAEQALAAWFAAITPRTAGFNTIAVEQLTDASTLLTLFLMFIGGGSLSTASGLKLGTFVVLLLTTWSYLRQHPQVTAFSRTVPEKQVKKALALVSITVMLIFLSIFLLSIIEKHHDFVDVLFEVISALSTVGLSRGITTDLSSAGEFVLMFMMFVGRVGPLTLAYFIAVPKTRRVRYPETEVQVG